MELHADQVGWRLTELCSHHYMVSGSGALLLVLMIEPQIKPPVPRAKTLSLLSQ